MGVMENDNLEGSFLRPYESLYPSSMISENIGHGDSIRDKMIVWPCIKMDIYINLMRNKYR